MSKRRFALIGAAALAAALALGTVGSVWAQAPGPGWGPGGMMWGQGPMQGPMMGGPGWGPGGPGWMHGPGMMGGPGMMAGPGMMGGFWYNAGGPIESLDEAKQAFQGLLTQRGDANLALGEVMEFTNHYYAVVTDTTTGTGAFELLAEKSTGLVHFEHGPAMMWNTTYGHMGGFGRGPMAPWQQVPSGVEPSVTVERAREIAQAWLDTAQPGSTVEEVITFPGYYTAHVVKDGTITGMLSVNAYTGQVWYHWWHGAFVGASEATD
jgi:hypothetical protein